VAHIVEEMGACGAGRILGLRALLRTPAHLLAVDYFALHAMSPVLSSCVGVVQRRIPELSFRTTSSGKPVEQHSDFGAVKLVLELRSFLWRNHAQRVV